MHWCIGALEPWCILLRWRMVHFGARRTVTTIGIDPLSTVDRFLDSVWRRFKVGFVFVGVGLGSVWCRFAVGRFGGGLDLVRKLSLAELNASHFSIRGIHFTSAELIASGVPFFMVRRCALPTASCSWTQFFVDPPPPTPLPNLFNNNPYFGLYQKTLPRLFRKGFFRASTYNLYYIRVGGLRV